MKVTNKKAYDAVIKARTKLTVGQPFFGCLALMLQLVEIGENGMIGSQYCDTMAVDGVHMFYYPPFVLKITEAELEGVVAHEVMHCAYKHMTRRQHRDPLRWNMAGDFIINADLKKANFTLPDPHLYDAQYDGLSTEEVYARLPDPPTITITMSGKGQGGKGQGKPDQRQFDNMATGGVIDAAAPHDKKTADQIEHEWEGNVRMAVNVAQRDNAGQTPGYLERLVHDLKAPRVSWRDLTRQFIDQSISKDYSFRKPNRRYIHAGMIMPGLISDALHELVMCIDCSGSISDAMMRSYVSEVAGALDDGTTDKLIVVYADDGVRHVDEFLPGDLVTCSTMGGGGTNFNDTFKWIKENAPDAAAVIYLTDMMTCSFGEDPDIPTLWAAYLPEAQLSSHQPPFGTVVHIDSVEG